MPIYEYKCTNCGDITTILSRVADKPDFTFCSCGHKAKFILSVGAILTDGDVKWLPSARETLQPDGERPIETRGEHKKYLKDHHLECIG